MADWAQDLDELRVGFLRRSRERVAEARRLIEELMVTPGARPPLVALHALLHKVTGAAGIYGYPEVSVDAGAATHTTEELIEVAKSPDAADLAAILAAITRISERLDRPPKTPDP